MEAFNWARHPNVTSRAAMAAPEGAGPAMEMLVPSKRLS